MGMCKYRDCKYGVFPRKGTYRRIRQHIAIDRAWNPFLDSDRTMARGEWEPDDTSIPGTGVSVLISSSGMYNTRGSN